MRGAKSEEELVWLSNPGPNGKQIALEGLLINFRISPFLPHQMSRVLSWAEEDDLNGVRVHPLPWPPELPAPQHRELKVGVTRPERGSVCTLTFSTCE